MVADDRVRGPVEATHCAPEAGFRTGAVPLLSEQHINDLPLLVNGTIEGALLSTAEAAHGIHIPPPPSPIAIDCLSQLRAEGLHPIQPRARRDIEVALRQQLYDVVGRQGITGIPAYGGENYIRRPTGAREGSR